MGLLPLSALFAGVAGLRRFLFKAGILRVERLPVPVIVVSARNDVEEKVTALDLGGETSGGDGSSGAGTGAAAAAGDASADDDAGGAPAEWQAAWEAGRALSLDQALAAKLRAHIHALQLAILARHQLDPAAAGWRARSAAGCRSGRRRSRRRRCG